MKEWELVYVQLGPSPSFMTKEELYQEFAERFRRENEAQGEINHEPLGWQVYEIVERKEGK